MMIRSRPFNALLAGLFLLHLVVVGSGLGMSMREGGAMQGMQMAASSTSGSAEAGEFAAPSSESDEVPCGMPCEMPGMPNTCPSSLLCYSGTSLPAGYERLLSASTRDVRPAPLALRAPHALLSPPELPPPRA